jgi:uncharacterized membrane protein
MSWFLLALFAPALWASTNFFDKYLVEKYFHGSGAGALMIFSALVGIIVLPIVVIVEPGVLSTDVSSAAAIIPLGWIYLCGIIPYLYALQKGDVTVVVPMWQLIPVISLFFGMGISQRGVHIYTASWWRSHSLWSNSSISGDARRSKV